MIEIWFLYFLVQQPDGSFRREHAGEYQSEVQCEIGAYTQLPFAQIWLGFDVGWICEKSKST